MALTRQRTKYDTQEPETQELQDIQHESNDNDAGKGTEEDSPRLQHETLNQNFHVFYHSYAELYKRSGELMEYTRQHLNTELHGPLESLSAELENQKGCIDRLSDCLKHVWVQIYLDDTGRLQVSQMMESHTKVHCVLSQLPALVNRLLTEMQCSQSHDLKLRLVPDFPNPAPQDSFFDLPCTSEITLEDIMREYVPGTYQISFQLLFQDQPIDFQELILRHFDANSAIAPDLAQDEPQPAKPKSPKLASPSKSAQTPAAPRETQHDPEPAEVLEPRRQDQNSGARPEVPSPLRHQRSSAKPNADTMDISSLNMVLRMQAWDTLASRIQRNGGVSKRGASGTAAGKPLQPKASPAPGQRKPSPATQTPLPKPSSAFREAVHSPAARSPLQSKQSPAKQSPAAMAPVQLQQSPATADVARVLRSGSRGEAAAAAESPASGRQQGAHGMAAGPSQNKAQGTRRAAKRPRAARGSAEQASEIEDSADEDHAPASLTPARHGARAQPAGSPGRAQLPKSLVRTPAGHAPGKVRFTWGVDDVSLLLHGIQAYGCQWSMIQAAYFPAHQGTGFQVKLKDKWRELCQGRKNNARKPLPEHLWQKVKALSALYRMS